MATGVKRKFLGCNTCSRAAAAEKFADSSTGKFQGVRSYPLSRGLVLQNLSCWAISRFLIFSVRMKSDALISRCRDRVVVMACRRLILKPSCNQGR